MAKTIGIYSYGKSTNDTRGGMEAQTSHLAHTLASQDYNVVVHCFGDDAAITFDGDGVSFASRLHKPHDRITIFSPLHGPGIEGAAAENTNISRNLEEDLIICIGPRDGYVFDTAFAAKKDLGVPVVSLIHFTAEERWFRSHFSARTRSVAGLSSPEEKAAFYANGEDVVRRIVDNSDLVIAPTHYVRAQVLALAGVDKAHKVRLCYHGANEHIFARPPHDWKSGKDILNVARLHVPHACDKGFLWAMQFYAQHHQELNTGKLVFCGTGNGEKVIKQYIDMHNLTEQMEVAGFVEQHALADKYNHASYLLLPSMMEAGCTVVVEAAMAGCLPVALDSAGLAEIMENIGLEDFVVPGRPQPLAPGLEVIVPQEDVLVDLLHYCESHESEVSKKLMAAQQIALEKYSITATTAKLLGILKTHKLLRPARDFSSYRNKLGRAAKGNITSGEQNDEFRVYPKSQRNQNTVANITTHDGRFFAKVFDPEGEARYESERSALQYFHENGLAVPHYVATENISVDERPHRVLITKALGGTCLQERISACAPSEIDKIAASIVDALKKQKQLAIRDDDIPLIKEQNMRESLERLKGKFCHNGVEDSTVDDIINQALAEAARIPEATEHSYVTHDWRLRHIFVEGTEFSGVLDLEYVKPNDFAVEVAHLLHDLRLNGGENGALLGKAIITRLDEIFPETDNSATRRVKLYMTKQALTHVVARIAQGTDLASHHLEVALSRAYQSAPDLMGTMDYGM